MADSPLWWWAQAVLVARERLLAVKKEKRVLIQRARDWMAEDRRRTIGEADDYIGVRRLNDDIALAKHSLAEALDSFAEHAAEILATLGKEK